MQSKEGGLDQTSPSRESVVIGQWRIALGIAQGLTAWVLLRLVAPSFVGSAAANSPPAQYWSAHHPMLFAAFALMTVYVPVIAILEIGRMRGARLARYIAWSGVLIGAFAAYDIWRDPVQKFGVESAARVWPSFAITFCTAIAIFIVNQLLEHRERGHRLFEHYADHFEDSWMRAFQLAVSLIFALLVLSVLELGALLFGLIHIDWFRTLINHNWFRCPASAAGFAVAIHLTDVRPSLLKGVRNIGLTLLSWLLPLVITLGAGFLIGLACVGLKPLWATGHAASILLWACTISVLLLNAAYKDGDPSALPPAALRWTGRMAGPTILLLALVAAYALGLRVSQHGWTPSRVFSVAVVIMALVYGAGYTVASVSRIGWLRALEKVNVTGSLVMLGLLALLLSPVVDPARVSVASQLRRLSASDVLPEQFDYQLLRFDTGRFGTQALERLAEGPNPVVRSRASLMQQTKVRQFYPQGRIEPAVTEAAFAHAVVYPQTAQLPDGFKSADFSSTNQYDLNCLRNGAPCEIYIMTNAEGGTDLIVRLGGTNSGSTPRNQASSGLVFQLNTARSWVNTGNIHHLDCPGVVDALREGKLTPVRPEHDDWLVNGLRLHFTPSFVGDEACVKQAEPAIEHKPRDPHAPPHMGPAFGQPGGGSG